MLENLTEVPVKYCCMCISHAVGFFFVKPYVAMTANIAIADFLINLVFLSKLTLKCTLPINPFPGLIVDEQTS